jgi:hypothetical protein
MGIFSLEMAAFNMEKQTGRARNEFRATLYRVNIGQVFLV